MTATFTPPAGFKGLWIPACIQLDHDLQPLQKMVLAEIYQLQQNKDERCWASNAHLCGIVCTSERNLRYILAPLEEKGLLRRQSRSSRRRKLVVASHVVAAIKAESQEPVSHPEDQSAGGAERSAFKSAKLTGDPANPGSEPGSLRTDPATDCRSSRKAIATKSTLRVQQEKTDKETTNNNMGNFDFSYSRKNASTHLVDEAGNQLVRMHIWEEWMCHQNEGWLVTKKASEEEQIAILARMVAEGFDGEALLMECTRQGMDTFWEEPPSHLVPKSLNGQVGVAV